MIMLQSDVLSKLRNAQYFRLIKFKILNIFNTLLHCIL